MCCTWLAENTWRKNYAKNRTILLGCIFVTKAHIDNRKELFKQQYLFHMSSQYGELRLTNGWDRLVSLGHPSKFQRVSRLGFVTAPTSLIGGQPSFARCLAVSWAGTLYIHFWGLLPPNGILPGAKFTSGASLAFSCIGSVTVQQHSSCGHQQNFAAWYLYATEWPSRWTLLGQTV